MTSRNYEAIICDGEGVVIDTEGIWDQVQAEFLGRRGIEYDRAVVKPLLAGRSQRDGMRLLMNHYGLDGEVTPLMSERQSLFWHHLHDRVDLITGFAAWWSCAGSGSKLALATSLPRELLDVVERRLDLSRYFSQHVYSISDIIGESKPAPDLFLFAARQLDVAPARCVVIEDSPVGIEAGRRAGMRTVGLATTFTPSVLASADLVVDRWDQLDESTLANLPSHS